MSKRKPDDGTTALAPPDPAAAALTAAQRAAIEHLAAGDTPADAADAAGVGRSTVYRWIKADPAFAAAHHAWQAQAVATARGRLLALADAAVTTVAAAVAKGDVRTALTVLGRQGLLTPPTPGSTDPATVARLDRQRRARDAEAMMVADERLPPHLYAPEPPPDAAADDPAPFTDPVPDVFADPNDFDPNALDLARLDAALRPPARSRQLPGPPR